MMDRQAGDQGSLSFLFNLPKRHPILRRKRANIAMDQSVAHYRFWATAVIPLFSGLRQLWRKGRSQLTASALPQHMDKAVLGATLRNGALKPKWTYDFRCCEPAACSALAVAGRLGSRSTDAVKIY